MMIAIGTLVHKIIYKALEATYHNFISLIFIV